MIRKKSGAFIARNVKAHRTGFYHSNNPYEDYAVLFWMDENGNLKKKGKKRLQLEYQVYEPRDFVKTWDIPIEIGDYGIEVMNQLQGDFIGRTRILIFQVEEFYRNESWIDAEYYEIRTRDIGELSKVSLEMPVEEIQKEFDEKFWNAIKKALKIPPVFKKVKKYKKLYYGE
jgi:hypothetical protein